MSDLKKTLNVPSETSTIAERAKFMKENHFDKFVEPPKQKVKPITPKPK